MPPKPTKPPLMPAGGRSQNVGPEWERLATALRARRQELDLRQQDVARRAGISYSAYTPLETQRSPYLPSTRVLRKVSAAVGWTTESAELILAGKKPVVADTPTPTRVEPRHEPAGDSLATDLAVIRDRDPESYAALIMLARRLAKSV